MKRALLAAMLMSCLSAGTATAATGEYGGHCAYGLTTGQEVKTDCKINWTDPATKKMYCFSSEQAKTSWAADVKNNMVRADAGFQAAQAKALAATQTAEAMKQAGQQMDAAQKQMKDAQAEMNKAMAGMQKPGVGGQVMPQPNQYPPVGQ